MKTRFKEYLSVFFTLGIGIVAIIIVIYVIQQHLYCLRIQLFSSRNLLAAHETVTNSLVRKSVLGVLMMVPGVFCFFLDQLVVNDHFLSISRIFFYAAMVISTIWDPAVLFYLTSESVTFWNRIQNISAALFMSALLVLIRKKIERQEKSVFLFIFFLVTAFDMVFNILLSQYQVYLVWRVYVASLIACVILLLLHIKKHQKVGRRTLAYCFILLAYCAYMGFLYGQNRLSNTRMQKEIISHYKTVFSLTIAILSFGLFVTEFYAYRRIIFYDKGTNQKLDEISKYRENVLAQINNYYIRPLWNASITLKLLSQRTNDVFSKKMKELSNIIQGTVSEMNDIQQFGIVAGYSVQIEKTEISYKLLFEMALQSIFKDNSLVIYSSSGNQFYVYGAPYQLLYLHKTILREFSDIRGLHPVKISVISGGLQVMVRIESSFNPESRKAIKRLAQLLSEKSERMASHGLDLPLITAKRILFLHNGEITARVNNEAVVVEYCIPIIKKEEERGDIFVQPGKDSEEKIILFITSVREEARLIETYMLDLPQQLVIFYDELKALNYIKKTQKLGAIIIGTIFRHLPIEDLCARIRDAYSIQKLSIILLYKEDSYIPSESIQDMVNDLLCIPFMEEEFTLKIRSAIQLQNSTNKLLKAQFDMMQSQIQPHFIFNSINTIMPLCIEDPKQAYVLLGDFGEYLRGNLFSGEYQPIATIYKEMGVIRAYLELEKARFGNLVNYNINYNCPDNCSILPLLVEPIVENCIKHGFDRRHCIHIMIDLLVSEGFLYVQVRDDGTGMNEEKVSEILQRKGNRIGLSNISNRLLMYYEQKLNIQSKEGDGTTVSFRIPVSLSEE